MALRLITGNPGSGKSYFMVHHLIGEYFTFDGEVYQPKDGVTLICNIEEFKPAHLVLDDVIKASKIPYTRFFTVAYQEKVVEKHGRVVYVIDEAQRFFDEYFRDKDVIYFFEYHRHLGIDIYLMTQNAVRICRAIRDLCEYEMRAARRFTSFMGEFKYKVMIGGEIADTRVLKRDKRLFALYRSFRSVENEKIRNPMLKFLGLAGAASVGGIVLFYFTFFGGPSGRPKAGGSSVAASAVAAAVPSRVAAEARRWVRWSFIQVGSEFLVVDPVSCELVSVNSLRRGCRVVDGEFPKVWLNVTEAELEKFKARGESPAPSRGGETSSPAHAPMAARGISPSVKDK